MKKIFLIALASLAMSAGFAQDVQKNDASKYRTRYGLKAGYNVAWMTGTPAHFEPSNRSGFMAGAFLAPPARGGMGFRTEIVFSRQGFSYDASGNKHTITQDYLYLPQFTTFGIGKVVQLQLGGQIGFLLNAKSSQGSETSTEKKIMDYYNRFDYGFAGGLEIYPFKGLLIGARYNISLGNAFKTPDPSTMPMPSPLPFDPTELKGKNSVVNFFLGYKF
jgi:hypothetical protein